MQKPPNRTRKPHIHLRKPQLDATVIALFGQVDIVHAHDLPAFRVDNLLVEQIFANREPPFVRLIQLQCPLAAVQPDRSGRYRRDLVVPRQQGLKSPARQQEPRDPVGLVRGLDEKLAHASDEIPLVVVRFRTHQFRSVQLHVPPLRDSSAARTFRRSRPRNKKPASRYNLRPRASASTQWTYL